MSVQQELLAYIDTLQIVDSHEHLQYEVRERRRRR